MESEFLSVGRCPLEVHKDIIQYVTDDPISLKNLSHAKLAAARDYRLGPKGTTMTEVDQDLPRTTGWTHLKQLAVQEDRVRGSHWRLDMEKLCTRWLLTLGT